LTRKSPAKGKPQGDWTTAKRIHSQKRKIKSGVANNHKRGPQKDLSKTGENHHNLKAKKEELKYEITEQVTSRSGKKSNLKEITRTRTRKINAPKGGSNRRRNLPK